MISFENELRIMRNALVRLAREKHPSTSIRAGNQRSIAREALVAIGWDWQTDAPAAMVGSGANESGVYSKHVPATDTGELGQQTLPKVDAG